MEAPFADTDIERALLGALIANPIREAFDEIDASMFTRRAHRLIFAAMRDVARDGGLDAITLRAELIRRGQLDEVGGDPALAALCSGDFVTTHWRAYVDHLRDLATRRIILAQAEMLAKAAHAKNFDPQTIAEFGRNLTAMAEEKQNKHGDDGGIWAAELMARQFEPLLWIADGLLPSGMAILAGRAKLGKSRLALQLCVAVATGGLFLGRAVEHGACLYVSLEMGQRMLQQRLHEMGAPADMPLKLYTNWQPADRGGTERLLTEIASRRWRVVVVDTLTRFLGGRVDLNDAGQMTDVLAPLQMESQSQNILLIFVNHHNKMSLRGESYMDLVADSLGSSAVSNVADTLIGFYKDTERRVLRIEGREIEPQEVFVAFDTVTCTWQPSERVYAPQSEVGKVLYAINHIEKEGGIITTGALVERTGLKQPNVSAVLARLVSEGRISQIQKGVYRVNQAKNWSDEDDE